MPLIRSLGCAWSSVDGSAEARRKRCGRLVGAAATRWASAPVCCSVREATATCACKPPRIGLPASTSTTLATAAKQGHSTLRPEAPTIDGAAVPEIGDEQGAADSGQETSRQPEAGLPVRRAGRNSAYTPCTKSRSCGRRCHRRTRRRRGDARVWRKPGGLWPSDDVVAFPRMSAMQGAQRSESQACAALLR